MSVMALQGHKSSPQKSRPLESGNRRHAVWIAIELSTDGPDGPDHTTRP